MHHCVASYADRCAAGKCSIWSLKALVGDLVMERRTVEVSRDRVIGCPATPTGQRGTPTRCRRRSSTSRKRRTATAEPQVNDRPDQRSVI